MFVALASPHARGAAEAPAEQKAGSTVFLKSQEPEGKSTTSGKLLVRELARQAVLIAARNQLGLPTRDMTWRESMPVEGGETPLDMRVKQERDAVRVILNHGKAKLFEKKFAANPIDGAFDYVAFAAVLDEASTDALVEALKKAGFQGNAHAIKPESAVPAEINSSLRKLNFFSQFSAIRQLHALAQFRRRIAPNTRRVGAWLRQPRATHQLSLERHAQGMQSAGAALRTTAREVGSRQRRALWHRAYAEALVGLHTAALADLKAARELADKSGTPIPSWEPLIDGRSVTTTPAQFRGDRRRRARAGGLGFVFDRGKHARRGSTTDNRPRIAGSGARVLLHLGLDARVSTA